MWYKNAGYTIKGICEIDKEMVDVYNKNFPDVQQVYHMSIVDFNKYKPRDDLINIDILDWSPPCSTFSMAWSREKARGVKKKFREWQAAQVLDDLFFHFLDTVELLRPKVVVAENVKGMLQGKARWYVKMIAKRFDELWYKLQIFLFNGASMWLPQRRERVFFLAHDKKYDLPDLKFYFNDQPIRFQDICDDTDQTSTLSSLYNKYREQAQPWQTVGKFMSNRKVQYNKVCNTIVSSSAIFHPKYKRELNTKELSLIGSFPQDYNYWSVKPKYLIGMSVPPLMMYRIASEIKTQWLDKIPK